MTLDEFIEHEQLQGWDGVMDMIQNRLNSLRMLPTSTPFNLFGIPGPDNQLAQKFQEAYEKAIRTRGKTWVEIMTDLDTVDLMLNGE